MGECIACLQGEFLGEILDYMKIKLHGEVEGPGHGARGAQSI